MEEWKKPLLLLVAAALLGITVRVHQLRSQPALLPIWEEPGPHDRILILAPHPDDETLAAGGLIQRATQRGAEVRVVTLTDGDGFRVAAAAHSGRSHPTPANCLALGRARLREAESAAGHLGLPAGRLTFLGYPDRGLWPLWVDFWDAARPYRSIYTRLTASAPAAQRAPGWRERPYTGSALLADLRAAILAQRPTAVYLPDARETNVDHRAAHLFGISAVAKPGALGQVRVATYLVHHPGWPGSGAWPWRAALLPPEAIGPAGWNRFTLRQEERGRKRCAIAAYRSQLAVMDGRLQAFDRPNEIFSLYRPESTQPGRETYSSPASSGAPQIKGGILRVAARTPADRRARLFVRLLDGRADPSWSFIRGQLPPPDCESRVSDGSWGVAIPMPRGATRPCGIWVGFVSAPGGRSPAALPGWTLWPMPTPASGLR